MKDIQAKHRESSNEKLIEERGEQAMMKDQADRKLKGETNQ